MSDLLFDSRNDQRRAAVGALYTTAALELLCAAVPVVDLDGRGALAEHLQALYGPYGVAVPDAAAVVTYLVAVGVVGALACLATVAMVRRGWRSARLWATAGLLVGLAVAVVNLAVSEYGQPILPMWLGLIGLLPSVAGVVAVILLWRRNAGQPT
jgi:hypothetical protein